MKFRSRQIGFYSAVLLLAAAVIAGCVTHSKPSDTDWEFDRPEGGQQQNSTARQIGGASTAYYQCCGKWPVSMLDLRSMNCTNAARRQQISNYLAAVQWNTLTKVAFKTEPDGRLLISVDFVSRTISTNGATITFGGINVTEVLDAPKHSKK